MYYIMSIMYVCAYNIMSDTYAFCENYTQQTNLKCGLYNFCVMEKYSIIKNRDITISSTRLQMIDVF